MPSNQPEGRTTRQGKFSPFWVIDQHTYLPYFYLKLKLFKQFNMLL